MKHLYFTVVLVGSLSNQGDPRRPSQPTPVTPAPDGSPHSSAREPQQLPTMGEHCPSFLSGAPATGFCVQLDQSANSDSVRSRVPLLNSRFASHQLVTASECAKLVRCRKAAVIAALKSGELHGLHDPAGRGGHGMWRIRMSDLEAWIERRCRRSA